MKVPVLSASQGFRRDAMTLRPKDVDLATDGNWRIECETLRGGKQEGVQLVTVDNGALKIRVVPDRGMGILDVRGEGIRLGWDSPVREIVHPRCINLEARGGLGWLDGFNEFMVRCGLEWSGHPTVDSFITNTGEKQEQRLTLHGKIANIPASEVEIEIAEKPPYAITLRGVVHECLFFGPNLKLVAEVILEPGKEEFTVRDVVTNLGGKEQEFQLIHHTNYGPPLLEAGAKFGGWIESVEGVNPASVERIQGYETYGPPTAGYVEGGYLIVPRVNTQGETTAWLQNAAGDLAASMTWPVAQFPHLMMWKNDSALADGYVTGIEPGTSYPRNRNAERQAGRVPKLAPGETREFVVRHQIHRGAEAVKSLPEMA